MCVLGAWGTVGCGYNGYPVTVRFLTDGYPVTKCPTPSTPKINLLSLTWAPPSFLENLR